MAEGMPEDERANLTSGLLKAKYANDEETRRRAGSALIETLRDNGRYSVLIDLRHDAGVPLFLQDEAEKSILQAAFVSFRKSGMEAPLFDVATRQDVPLDVARHAGLALVLRNSLPYNEEGLWAIIIDPRFHDEARLTAGNNMAEQSAADLKFSALFRLATIHEVMYEVKKPASLALIRLAVEQGNYPILLRLQDRQFLPVDTRIALEDKVEEAATMAIAAAYSAKDFAILTDISEDRRLPDSIRSKAAGCLQDSISDRPPSCEGLPGPEMAAELMFRLGKGAGAVHSSVEPPAPANHPIGRLKR